eukprot:CAMPEP_0114565404 /NCGR_PEP_ID=MMETSP0114-20121206/14287_1 /TAXON_ID=31324 /ORGANISM="Goniomonas sp, Strain m" /LENGTH=64 /DNA_ID=CAMNT_0001751639 /DNA_START=750 /DNA_END=940 /DNA_ORIENTATION=-
MEKESGPNKHADMAVTRSGSSATLIWRPSPHPCLVTHASQADHLGQDLARIRTPSEDDDEPVVP